MEFRRVLFRSGPDLHISDRTRTALDRVRAAGIHVVPVTARQPVGLRLIAEECGFVEWALCGNGALGLHLGTGERLFERSITVEAQQALVAALEVAVPGVLHASVREEGEVFVAQEGYAEIVDSEDTNRDHASKGEQWRAGVGHERRWQPTGCQ